VFGLGNSQCFKDRFNVIVKNIDSKMKRLGTKSITPLGTGTMKSFLVFGFFLLCHQINIAFSNQEKHCWCDSLTEIITNSRNVLRDRYGEQNLDSDASLNISASFSEWKKNFLHNTSNMVAQNDMPNTSSTFKLDSESEAKKGDEKEIKSEISWLVPVKRFR
jgi:hypothetical protein